MPISEKSLRETLENIFPFLTKEKPPHEIQEKDEFTKLTFTFKEFTPDNFCFKFDDDGILNTEFGVDIDLNGTVKYNLTYGTVSSKFKVSIKNLNYQEKVKLNVTKDSSGKYNIVPEFISEPKIDYSYKVSFIDTYHGDEESMKENIRENLLETYFIQYIKIYEQEVIKLTISYNKFLNNN